MLKKNKELYLMCGIPGSGKSTFIKNHLAQFDGYVKVVSRDEIRFSKLLPGDEYFAHETEVWRKYVEEIKDGLEYADGVIADATHLGIASRTKLLRALGSSLEGVKVIPVVMDIPLEKCLERNEQRKGTLGYVPRGQIRRMACSFTLPTIDEGFKDYFRYDGNTIYHVVNEEA